MHQFDSLAVPRYIPRLVTAKRLGVSDRVVDTLIDKGLLEAIKIGQLVQVREDSVLRLTEQSRISPKDADLVAA